jgi:hypothetical protein
MIDRTGAAVLSVAHHRRDLRGLEGRERVFGEKRVRRGGEIGRTVDERPVHVEDGGGGRHVCL